MMSCTQCRARRPLHHKPGIFLAVGLLAFSLAVISHLLDHALLVFFFGLSSLVALCGVFTAMTDASAPVYSRHGRNGALSKACGHINRIFPWSV